MITVDKVGTPSVDTMTRNKRSLAVNLKEPRGTRIVSSLAKKVSGFAQPGSLKQEVVVLDHFEVDHAMSSPSVVQPP